MYVCIFHCLKTESLLNLGNNFYGKDLLAKLRDLGRTPEREAYILMDRVLPPTQVIITINNYM